jgi:hypothetical protein
LINHLFSFQITDSDIAKMLSESVFFTCTGSLAVQYLLQVELCVSMLILFQLDLEGNCRMRVVAAFSVPLRVKLCQLVLKPRSNLCSFMTFNNSLCTRHSRFYVMVSELNDSLLSSLP